MTNTDWKMKGRWIKNCNCDFGCPCDFNSKPTHGNCTGMVGMSIDQGHFGDVDLTGLRWAAVYSWPGALHEGNGTMQPVIEETASEDQRNALLTILSGQEQVDGTFFKIVSSVVTSILEPQFLPMEFEFDLESRKAKFSAPGIFETISEPIRNPVTGQDHRIRIEVPEGFEHKSAETACATINKGVGQIKYDCPDSHSTMALVEHTNNGLI